jgi:hypothetical protein
MHDSWWVAEFIVRRRNALFHGGMAESMVGGGIHCEKAECTIPWWVAESMAVAESIVRRQNAQFHGGVAEFIG